MKNILSLLSLTLLTIWTLPAQDRNSGTLNATEHKTFTIKADGTETKYNIKVLEHRNYPMNWEKEDKGKVDQDRKSVAAKVTKLIAVDNDNDNMYEQYFVLKYRKSIVDTFEAIATDKGFAVKVDDKIRQRFERKGIYFINNKDQDFFTIEEFREIG